MHSLQNALVVPSLGTRLAGESFGSLLFGRLRGLNGRFVTFNSTSDQT